MSDAIIRVEGLGKKYRLGASRSNERYTTLRDTVAAKTGGVFKKLKTRKAGKLKNGSAADPQSAIRNPSSEDFWALKDVSFEVKQGEVLGIIGRNGAGKSTLLKILSRITEPTEGRIRIRGRVASLLEVGTGFHPELTGRENIFLNGAILGMARAEIKAKFEEIVAFAEVERFIDTPVKRYSSGMYVRLAFAVAAHLDPEILVVDEVLAVGDAEFQKKCLGKMQQVARGEGRTVLFVSHNMEAIVKLCSRAILLSGGRLQVDRDARTATEAYLKTGYVQMGVQRKLTDDVEVDRIDFTPETAESGGEVSVKISLRTNAETALSELAILIYSETGVRIGIIDCRTDRFPMRLACESVTTVTARIERLPLTAGEYAIGVYAGTSNGKADGFDLARLSVSPSGRLTTLYAREYLGYVDMFPEVNVAE